MHVLLFDFRREVRGHFRRFFWGGHRLFLVDRGVDDGGEYRFGPFRVRH